MGGEPGHPLRPALHDGEIGDDSAIGLLNRLERLLQQIEAAKPLRWEGKRREFRTLRTDDTMFSLRSELVLANALLRRAVPYEFPDRRGSRPDFVLTDLGVGIELGSRNVDGARDLEDAIQNALRQDDNIVSVHLTYDYEPLIIRSEVREAIVAKIRQLIPVDELLRPPDPALGIPACMVRIRIEPADQLLISRDVTNPQLTWTMADIIREIRHVVMENDRKLAQARSMPKLLIVDLTRCGIAWLGQLGWRAQELTETLTPTDPYIGVGVMVAGYETNTPQFALATNPNAAEEDAKLMSTLRRRLSNATGIEAHPGE
jgi:hypothetical protein